jgi:Uma2 family endonuclease
MSAPATVRPVIIYPDSDGEPMADNSHQAEVMIDLFQWLSDHFAGQNDVAVHTNLLWYPVEGRPDVRRAPDVMAIFGRPPGRRGSYKQWEEGGIAPQVVFEIYSPGNRPKDLLDKFRFYEHYGVEEYYFFDPDSPSLSGWRRIDDDWEEIETVNGFMSPRLGLTFRWSGGDRFELLNASGQPLKTHEQMRQALEAERLRAEQAAARADEESARAAQATARAERLAAELRRLGVNPNGDATGGNP